MIRTIYKYLLELTDRQVVRLPRHSEVLTVQARPLVNPAGQAVGEQLCLWAIVDAGPAAAHTLWEVFVLGTGNNADITMGLDAPNYLTTVQMANGALVWHLFIHRLAETEES